MGRSQRGVPEAPAVGEGGKRRAGGTADRDPRAPEPIGSYLAGQRELRGISLDELSAITRIPRRSLERLESGAFDADPDGFVRGFVRTVAVALGLPPEETLARMLPEVDPRGRVRRALPLGRFGVALLIAVLGAAGLAAGAWWLALAPASEGPTPASREIVHRRDFVRELADEQPRVAPSGRKPVSGDAEPASDDAELASDDAELAR